jgi:hypothetical protein
VSKGKKTSCPWHGTEKTQLNSITFDFFILHNRKWTCVFDLTKTGAVFLFREILSRIEDEENILKALYIPSQYLSCK